MDKYIKSGLGIDTPADASIGSIEAVLKRCRSGLLRVEFDVFPRLRLATWALAIRHSAAMWIGRCAARFGIGKLWILSILQKEKGLLSYRGKLDPYFAWRHLNAKESMSKKEVVARGYLQPGETALRTRGGWIGVLGQARMWGACGYAIPDPRKPAHFRTHRVIGFQRQVYEAARWTAARVREYKSFAAKGQAPFIDSPYDGNTYYCDDLMSYLGFRFTPHMKAQREWNAVIKWVKRKCQRS